MPTRQEGLLRSAAGGESAITNRLVYELSPVGTGAHESKQRTGSGLGVSLLLGQPHGFEGFGVVVVLLVAD